MNKINCHRITQFYFLIDNDNFPPVLILRFSPNAFIRVRSLWRNSNLTYADRVCSYLQQRFHGFQGQFSIIFKLNKSQTPTI